jgi:hypothetical protein
VTQTPSDERNSREEQLTAGSAEESAGTASPSSGADAGLHAEAQVAAAPALRSAGKPGALRRFFLMEEALREAGSQTFAEGQPGYSEYEWARRLSEGAEVLEELPERRDAALVMSREALRLGLRAWFLRSGVEPTEVSVSRARQTALPADAPLRAALEKLSPADTERLDGVLADRTSRALLDLTEAERTGVALQMRELGASVIGNLASQAERTARVRVKRGLRWLAVGVVVAAVVGGVAFALRSANKPPNVARGKPVTLSSYHKPEQYGPEKLTDGDFSTFGGHTKPEDNPWAQIDLGAVHTVRHIVVTNRQDKWKQRAVPMLIEVSADGKAFTEFAQREEAFDSWDATGAPTPARYVKLTVQKRTELHLTEVEVY